MAQAQVRSVGTTLATAVREQIGDDDEGSLRADLLPLEEARRDLATVRAQLVL